MEEGASVCGLGAPAAHLSWEAPDARGTSYLCIGKDIWGNNLVRAKRLLRIYKGCKNLSSLATFAWWHLSATSPVGPPKNNNYNRQGVEAVV